LLAIIVLSTPVDVFGVVAAALELAPETGVAVMLMRRSSKVLRA
jgi:hypothetical protein